MCVIQTEQKDEAKGRSPSDHLPPTPLSATSETIRTLKEGGREKGREESEKNQDNWHICNFRVYSDGGVGSIKKTNPHSFTDTSQIFSRRHTLFHHTESLTAVTAVIPDCMTVYHLSSE